MKLLQHTSHGLAEELTSPLTLIPASLSTAKVVLLTGDEENALLRVLFFPDNAAPEMRLLHRTFLDYLCEFGVVQFNEEPESSDAGSGDGLEQSTGAEQ
jgi:hypothetical protein